MGCQQHLSEWQNTSFKLCIFFHRCLRSFLYVLGERRDWECLRHWLLPADMYSWITSFSQKFHRFCRIVYFLSDRNISASWFYFHKEMLESPALHHVIYTHYVTSFLVLIHKLSYLGTGKPISNGSLKYLICCSCIAFTAKWGSFVNCSLNTIFNQFQLFPEEVLCCC